MQELASRRGRRLRLRAGGCERAHRWQNDVTAAIISSAVGPYAIDEGLVKPWSRLPSYGSITPTHRRSFSRGSVRDGRAVTEGDYAIDGVPGTGAKVSLKFVSRKGASSGKLFPTGRPKDTIKNRRQDLMNTALWIPQIPIIFVHPKTSESPAPRSRRSLTHCPTVKKSAEAGNYPRYRRGSAELRKGPGGCPDQQPDIAEDRFRHQTGRLSCGKRKTHPCFRQRHRRPAFLSRHENDRRLYGKPARSAPLRPAKLARNHRE